MTGQPEPTTPSGHRQPGECGQITAASLRLELRPDLAEVPRARYLAGRWAAQHGDHARQEGRGRAGGSNLDVADLELVVTELVTNAVRAAREAVRLRLSIEDSDLVVEVADDGPGLGEVEHADRPEKGPHPAARGRGLRIVEALTGELDISTGPDGTRVRAVLDLPEPAPTRNQPSRAGPA